MFKKNTLCHFISHYCNICYLFTEVNKMRFLCLPTVKLYIQSFFLFLLLHYTIFDISVLNSQPPPAENCVLIDETEVA